MTHDLRQALGYRRLPASDPQEAILREQWHTAKQEWVDAGAPDSGIMHQHFQHVDRQLSDYLWKRASDEREDDRKRHPKARRNLPREFPAGDGTPTRVLP
jgi:hypothetical protein